MKGESLPILDEFGISPKGLIEKAVLKRTENQVWVRDVELLSANMISPRLSLSTNLCDKSVSESVSFGVTTIII